MLGDPNWIFFQIFGVRKLESLALSNVDCMILRWAVSIVSGLWRTDRRTQSRSIYRDSIASRGKK